MKELESYNLLKYLKKMKSPINESIIAAQTILINELQLQNLELKNKELTQELSKLHLKEWELNYLLLEKKLDLEYIKLLEIESELDEIKRGLL